MDSLEITKPARASSIPASDAVPGPTVASCCSTATFPPDAVRSWLGNRWVLAGAGLAVGGGGLALGWDWLVAVGLAPLILSAAPCLVMCALGLCMMGKNQQAGSGQPAPDATRSATPTVPEEPR